MQSRFERRYRRAMQSSALRVACWRRVLENRRQQRRRRRIFRLVILFFFRIDDCVRALLVVRRSRRAFRIAGEPHRIWTERHVLERWIERRASLRRSVLHRHPRSSNRVSRHGRMSALRERFGLQRRHAGLLDDARSMRRVQLRRAMRIGSLQCGDEFVRRVCRRLAVHVGRRFTLRHRHEHLRGLHRRISMFLAQLQARPNVLRTANVRADFSRHELWNGRRRVRKTSLLRLVLGRLLRRHEQCLHVGRIAMHCGRSREPMRQRRNLRGRRMASGLSLLTQHRRSRVLYLSDRHVRDGRSVHGRSRRRLHVHREHVRAELLDGYGLRERSNVHAVSRLRDHRATARTMFAGEVNAAARANAPGVRRRIRLK